jgi:hypothetical protein
MGKSVLSKPIVTLIGIMALVVSMLFSIVACQQSLPTPTPDPAPPPISSPAATPPMSPPASTTKGAWIADGIISSDEYSKSKNLGGYELNWDSDGQNIYFGIKAKTTGWIALGIQPGSKMKGADIILGYVEGGKAYVSDHFSAGDFGPHKVDTEFGGENNILEYGGGEEGEYTTIEFKRALDTGDKYDQALSPGLNDIIWAFGTDDKAAQKHVTRGYSEINL